MERLQMVHYVLQGQCSMSWHRTGELSKRVSLKFMIYVHYSLKIFVSVFFFDKFGPSYLNF